jgi:iron complex transport system substrate-binding protein
MPQHRFRGILDAMVIAAAAIVATGAQAKPQRVVSLNLCADQLLLKLADGDQIASLSPLARDSSISFLAEIAASHAENSGKAESIVMTGAGLVLDASWGTALKRQFLARQGFEIMVLDPWRNLADGHAQIRALAKRLGHPERGERLIAAIDAALQETRNIVPPGTSILPIQRRGWVSEADSLTSETLRNMGFTLHQERLGLRYGGVAQLESLVATPPDYMVMDDIVGRAIDQGSALLVHPALNEIVPPERRLILSSRLAICGGPSTPAAIRALAEEVRVKVCRAPGACP